MFGWCCAETWWPKRSHISVLVSHHSLVSAHVSISSLALESLFLTSYLQSSVPSSLYFLSFYLLCNVGWFRSHHFVFSNRYIESELELISSSRELVFELVSIVRIVLKVLRVILTFEPDCLAYNQLHYSFSRSPPSSPCVFLLFFLSFYSYLRACVLILYVSYDV